MSTITIPTLTNEEYEERKKVWEMIKMLVKSEQEELFRILRRGEAEFSENSNGVFFDLSKLKQSIFEEILKFIQFCESNRQNFEQRDQAMAALRNE